MKLKKDKKGEFIEIKIDPYKSAVRLALEVGNMFEGYCFISFYRKKNKAKVYLEKNNNENLEK